jgi:hypothetical protein
MCHCPRRREVVRLLKVSDIIRKYINFGMRRRILGRTSIFGPDICVPRVIGTPVVSYVWILVVIIKKYSMLYGYFQKLFNNIPPGCFPCQQPRFHFFRSSFYFQTLSWVGRTSERLVATTTTVNVATLSLL